MWTKLLLIVLVASGSASANIDWLYGFAADWLYEGPSEYDLNGDGIVNFQDWTIITSKISDIDFIPLIDTITSTPLIFVRDTHAYVPHSGAKVSAGVHRIEPVTTASPVEVGDIEDKWVTGTDGQYLYAANGRVLYQSGDGQTWSVSNDFGATIRSMHVTENNTPLVGVNGGGVWRYNGNLWELVNTVEVGQVVNFGWTEAAGHVFASEYRTLFDDNNARRVYLSTDDGLTWQKIYEPDNVPGPVGQHAHTPCAAVVDDKVVCFQAYGDGDNSMIRKLQFDGTDWIATNINYDMKMNEQPTSAIWVPERNVILWGNDGSNRSGSICEHDLATNRFNILSQGDIQDFISSNYSDKMVNFFAASRIDGLYLFCGTGERNGVWISNDTINWTRLFSDNSSDGRFIVKFRDKLYWGDYGQNQTYYCDIPRVYNTQGLLVERASNNIMASEVFGNWSVDDDDNVMLVNEPAVDDRNNVKIRWHTENPIESPDRLRTQLNGNISSLQGDLTADEWVYFAGWVKGRYTNDRPAYRLLSNIETYDNTNYSATRVSNWRWFTPCDRWRRFTIAVKNTADHSANNSRARHYLQIRASQDNPSEVDFYTTDWILEAGKLCPASYHPRGTSRSHEIVTYSLDCGFAFTDVLTFAPTFDSQFLFGKAAGDYIFIKTYIEDSSNYMAIVLDAYEKKLKLVDHTGEIAESSTLEFYEKQVLVVAVIRDGTSARLKVWTPQGYESDSGTIESLAFMGVNYGSDINGENGGSFIFIRNQLYAAVFSPGTTKKLMQWPRPLISAEHSNP